MLSIDNSYFNTVTVFKRTKLDYVELNTLKLISLKFGTRMADTIVTRKATGRGT